MENISTVETSTINIFIPISLKKRGGSAMVILPDKGLEREECITTNNRTKSNCDYKLINLIVRAHKWNKQLSTNNHNNKVTIASIAAKEGYTPSHVGRIMRFNYLAPDIIEAILAGKQPRTLLAIDLMRKDIPALWQEQREIFGFITK